MHTTPATPASHDLTDRLKLRSQRWGLKLIALGLSLGALLALGILSVRGAEFRYGEGYVDPAHKAIMMGNILLGVFGGAILFVGAIVHVVQSWERNRIGDLATEPGTVVWDRYPADGWAAWVAAQRKQAMLIPALMGGAVALIGSAVGLLSISDMGLWCLAVIAGSVLFGTALALSLWHELTRSYTGRGEEPGLVVWGSNGVYIDGMYRAYFGFNQTLTDARLTRRDDVLLDEVRLTWRVNTKYGPRDMTLHLPIPPGRTPEAKILLQTLQTKR